MAVGGGVEGVCSPVDESSVRFSALVPSVYNKPGNQSGLYYGHQNTELWYLSNEPIVTKGHYIQIYTHQFRL